VGLKLHLTLVILLSVLVIILMQSFQTVSEPKIMAHSMEKENLILVHSFPTNSILLRGLVEYLEDDFNVYFIDLPGFTRKVSAPQQFSMDSNVRYLEQRISELSLDSYIIGGISFGFLVVNRTDLDPERCKAILAIEPYINKMYLNLGFAKSLLLTSLLDTAVENDDIAEKFWHNSYADDILSFLSGYTEDISRTMLKEIDGGTFFSTARYLIENEDPVVFKENIPYVLVINKEDQTVDALPIIKLFESSVRSDNLLIVYTNIEHYPKSITKEYFSDRFSPESVSAMINWVNSRVSVPVANAPL